MRFTYAIMLYLLTLTAALPAALPATKEKSSSTKNELVKGINANLKAGDKEISATEKAQKAAKNNDNKGLKKDEKNINGALNEAINDRKKNQKLAGTKDAALTKGLGKVETAQNGAKQTVKGLTGDSKKDQGSLDKLDATFKKGKATNTQNLEEAKKNFH
ncbi:uncharacterized protein ColSpa_10869 [Colletotrichum spaethianum]|uniref:Uncharacterized protein n=1 Tax=Colletotrichum spaethianum TaxID=700344 RepID=A0AA37USW4_9PEZI|nr:uncharacterized protein ColSpa_10869 [Colletotrichum spaethianum]GKT50688.1 hypothetical protein ColSpa_10869 [Colletotrichum spaethianum]